MKSVLIYSIPFGFGPTGKALAMANTLHLSCNVTLVSFNHSLQILNQNELFKIVDCKSRDFAKWHDSLFRDIDIVISVMDLRLIAYVSKNHPNIKTVFVDSLFWWRKGLEELPLETCDLFLIQTFPGVNEKLTQIPLRFVHKFYEVSPILPKYKLHKKSSEKYILLHFGGVDSLIVKWEMYQQFFVFITDIIKEICKDNGMPVIVTGNDDLMLHLKKENDEENISFECLDNEAFHEKLSQADIFITTCGIEAMYEAFEYKVPTIFLPPVNSTQLYQLMALISAKFLVVLPDKLTKDFLSIITDQFEYSQETLQIVNILNSRIKDPEIKKEVHTSIRGYMLQILSDSDFRYELLHKQTEFSNRAPYKWSEVLLK